MNETQKDYPTSGEREAETEFHPPIDTTGEDPFAAIQEMQDNDPVAAAKRLEAQEAARAAALPAPKERTSVKDALITASLIAGGVGVAALGVGGLVSMEGGSSHGAELGTPDNTIESITLSPDAHLRLDPYVGDPKDDTANDVLDLPAQVTIDANHDIRVLTDPNSGTWYGIPIGEVSAVIPDANGINDKDSILWVNEQGVEKVNKTDLKTQ